MTRVLNDFKLLCFIYIIFCFFKYKLAFKAYKTVSYLFHYTKKCLQLLIVVLIDLILFFSFFFLYAFIGHYFYIPTLVSCVVWLFILFILFPFLCCCLLINSILF